MKTALLMLACLALSVGGATQSAPAKQEKVCISFVSDSDNHSEDEPAKEPLREAVTLSRDYDFYPEAHDGCWSVRVLAMTLDNGNGHLLGYAVSYAVTTPGGVLTTHGMNTSGRDKSAFDRGMRAAAASAVQDIRLVEQLQRTSK